MWQKALVDQWLGFFTNHLGRWLNTYAFEKVAKTKFGFGTPDEKLQEEALNFILQQTPAVNEHLAKNTYFLENQESVADYVAFSHFENAEAAEISLRDYPAIENWYNKYKNSEVIAKAKKKMGI